MKIIKGLTYSLAEAAVGVVPSGGDERRARAALCGLCGRLVFSTCPFGTKLQLHPAAPAPAPSTAPNPPLVLLLLPQLPSATKLSKLQQPSPV